MKQKKPLADAFQNSVLKNFAICTGKQVCWSLFLIKLNIDKKFFRISLGKGQNKKNSQKMNVCAFKRISKLQSWEKLL